MVHVPFLQITGRFIKVGWAASKMLGSLDFSASERPRHVVEDVLIAASPKWEMMVEMSSGVRPSARTSVISKV